jgi:hypothetical protein
MTHKRRKVFRAAAGADVEIAIGCAKGKAWAIPSSWDVSLAKGEASTCNREATS